jgi:16S rRNA (guanine1207-N2)-methyltransferase
MRPDYGRDVTRDPLLPPSLTALLSELVPWPDDGTRPDGPVAVDATDRLLLAESATLLRSQNPEATGPDGETPDGGRTALRGGLAVVGDRFGALTVGVLTLGATDVRVHCDSVTAERAVTHHLDVTAARLGGRTARIVGDLGPELLDGASLVLLQLPKSLAELTEIAEAVARYASDDVVLLAGGRDKHMSRTMNDVLADRFRDVRATRGLGKSRALVAAGVQSAARTAPPLYPVTQRLNDPELLAAATPTDGGDGPEHVDVVAHGGAFAGAALDHGTRFLLSTAGRWPGADRVRDAVDLGCGTGLLSVVLAHRYPAARVVATDRSAAAVASTRATLTTNGLDARVLRDDAGADLPDASADVVLLNPPFHDRAAVSTDAAHRMFAAAGRVLRPGGELWCVYNTRLRYRGSLSRAVGPTEHIAQDPRFTVTRSRKL